MDLNNFLFFFALIIFFFVNLFLSFCFFIFLPSFIILIISLTFFNIFLYFIYFFSSFLEPNTFYNPLLTTMESICYFQCDNFVPFNEPIHPNSYKSSRILLELCFIPVFILFSKNFRSFLTKLPILRFPVNHS